MSNEITVLRSYDVSPAQLFDAWVSPATLVAPVTEVEMDATIGGRVRISTGESRESDLRGVFLVADRPNRLTYTWRWGGHPEESLVDVVFRAAGTTTVVVVNHRGFLDQASLDIHRGGWVAYLDGITMHL